MNLETHMSFLSLTKAFLIQLWIKSLIGKSLKGNRNKAIGETIDNSMEEFCDAKKNTESDGKKKGSRDTFYYEIIDFCFLLLVIKLIEINGWC
jgi:hypothetical protein